VCSSDLPLPEISPEALEAYQRRYLDFFPAQCLAGMRVGFYEHSSAARDVLTQLLTALGAQVTSLGRTDQFVPIDTEAVAAEDVERARAWAAEQPLDALLSTDGDADRPLLGDEHGNWLRGDVVGILCARILGIEGVVTPVSSNTALEKCGAFARVLRTRIGSPYVIEGMETLRAEGCPRVAGFEANGGFLLDSRIENQGRSLEALPTRDAVLPMLALMVQARTQGIPLSHLARELPARYTASDRLKDFPTAQSARLLQTLTQDAAARTALTGDLCGPSEALDCTDGLRIHHANGEIVHLRPSGNAPELRCYAEADSEARAEWLTRECLRRLADGLSKP
jgi:phosphomannomutase